MSLSTKELLLKNNSAYKQQYYIESIYLSYNLITRVIKQIIFEENLASGVAKQKLSEAIRIVKPVYDQNPLFTKKFKKSVFKSICEFNEEFKTISKELKYQYPELKLKNTAKKGLDVLVKMNTALIKLKSNNH